MLCNNNFPPICPAVLPYSLTGFKESSSRGVQGPEEMFQSRHLHSTRQEGGTRLCAPSPGCLSRELISFVWDFPPPPADQKDSSNAICCLCRKCVRRGKEGIHMGTSALRSHLEINSLGPGLASTCLALSTGGAPSTSGPHALTALLQSAGGTSGAAAAEEQFLPWLPWGRTELFQCWCPRAISSRVTPPATGCRNCYAQPDPHSCNPWMSAGFAVWLPQSLALKVSRTFYRIYQSSPWKLRSVALSERLL